MKNFLGLLFISILAACNQAPRLQTVEVTRIVLQTSIIQPPTLSPTAATPTWNIKDYKTSFAQTQAALPTSTSRPTSTPRPTNTQGPTNTPTETIAPYIQTATAQAKLDLILQSDHEPGFYLVGIDIAPGIWRSTPGNDDCYWSRNDRTGEIIDNYFGFSGSTIYIAPSDFSVELDKACGIWTWLSVP